MSSAKGRRSCPVLSVLMSWDLLEAVVIFFDNDLINQPSGIAVYITHIWYTFEDPYSSCSLLNTLIHDIQFFFVFLHMQLISGKTTVAITSYLPVTGRLSGARSIHETMLT